VYFVGVAFVAIVVLLIAFFAEETMYDRDVTPFPVRPTTGLRYRIETLLGITGWKMARYRCSWLECLTSWLDILWRPHALLMLILVGVIFGFGIGAETFSSFSSSFTYYSLTTLLPLSGINVTSAVFLGSPPPLGYGLSPYITSTLYLTPIVAVVLGEVAGRFLNDGVRQSISH